jgi:hypothetical protein
MYETGPLHAHVRANRYDLRVTKDAATRPTIRHTT